MAEKYRRKTNENDFVTLSTEFKNQSVSDPVRLKFNQLCAGWTIFLAIDVLKKSIWIADKNYISCFYIPGFLVWIFLSYLLLKIFNWSSRYSLIKRLGIMFIAGILAGISKHTISLHVYSWLGGENFQPPLERLKASFFYMESTIIAWIVLIIYFVIEFYRSYQTQSVRSMQLESELIQAQLRALKMQLQPHFLFNTHNSIITLIRSGRNEQAIKMLLGLSDLLRFSLTRSAEQKITLKEELDLLAMYLSIESERFEDGLKIGFDIEEDSQQAMVPNFMLQPLIENSIKHGISRNIGNSDIEISARQRKGYLGISIYNTAPSLGDDWSIERQTGIGLANTINRLRQLYGNDFEFKLSDYADGVMLDIRIPYETSVK